MKSDTVSIIIPIYNVEQYLQRCIQSVISQTHRSLEIILVDDGSSDNSPEICDRFAKQDSRIHVIHQDNQGLSAARNAGLDLATSDYIQFVDSDDWILPTMTEELMAVLQEDSSDAVQCDYYTIRGIAEDVLPNVDFNADAGNLQERKIYSGEDLFLQLTKDYFHTVVQWNKLFKKEVFENLRFPVGKLHEDEFVIHHELAKMKSMSYLDRKLYVYTQNPKGITQERTLKNSIHTCEAYLDRARFFAEYNIHAAALSAYAILLNMVAYAEEDLASYDEDQTEYKKIRDALCKIREDIKTIPTNCIFENRISSK